MNTIRRRLSALRNSRGAISVSIPELVVTIMVELVIVGGLLAAIAVMFAMSASTQASAKASSAFQSSSVQFQTAVNNADFVRGRGTDQVSLFTNDNGKCQIQTWTNEEVAGQTSLVLAKATVDGDCTETTAVPAATKPHTTTLLQDVDVNKFSYLNVAGRVITFDKNGNAILESRAQPDGISDEDWNDTRPQRVGLDVGALARKLTTYAKKAELVGFTKVINFSTAKVGSKYVPATDPIVAPVAIGNVAVTRSTTTGDVYSGTHEGAHLSFLGGECQDMASKITITWTPEAPSGQEPKTATFNRVIVGGPTTYDMPLIRNGAEGSFEVAAQCSLSAEPDTAKSFYEQTVPATILTVAHGAKPEIHALSWTPVSSLPTTFHVTYAAAPAKPQDVGDEGVTTALSKNVTFPDGTTYGFATNYTVTPNVAGVDGFVRTGGIVDLWPAAPAATNIRYTSTGSGPSITNGRIDWDYAINCPAGTIRQAREIQNVIWDSYTGAASTGNYTVGTYGSKTSANWTPPYALEGHPYQERVDTKCSSPITNSQSATNTVQSATFFTPMNSPAAPVYDGYDFRDYVRGDTYGYSTCWNIEPTNCDKTFPKGNAIDGGGFFDSYVLDYKTYCPAGSWLGWNYVRTDNLTHPGAGFDRFVFGNLLGWQLADADDEAIYLHSRPVYQCNTFWMASPTSSVGADTYYHVQRIWG